MRKPWTDYELGFIQDHDDWPTSRIAHEIGRTSDAVRAKRLKIRTGWEPKQEFWSNADAEFLLANPRMSAHELARHLGRTTKSVAARRKWLVRSGVTSGRFGGNWSPLVIGARPLLARTCPDCGLLLQARWFPSCKGSWGRICLRCRGQSEEKKRPSIDVVRRQKRESDRRFQIATIPGATQAGQPWTEADFTILRNPDMTVLQKALALHRTYAATQTACSRNGYKSTIGLGDPERDQWKIDNPNAGRVEEITSYLEADPTEPVWDWDESDLAVSA